MEHAGMEQTGWWIHKHKPLCHGERNKDFWWSVLEEENVYVLYMSLLFLTKENVSAHLCRSNTLIMFQSNASSSLRGCRSFCSCLEKHAVTLHFIAYSSAEKQSLIILVLYWIYQVSLKYLIAVGIHHLLSRCDTKTIGWEKASPAKSSWIEGKLVPRRRSSVHLYFVTKWLNWMFPSSRIDSR